MHVARGELFPHPRRTLKRLLFIMKYLLLKKKLLLMKKLLLILKKY